MKLSDHAEALIEQLWRCHQHNPVNHFEYLPGQHGGAIAHPASRRTVVAAPVALDELVRAGLVRGRWHLSLTFEGLQYVQDRRRSRRTGRRWRRQGGNG
jgi:hypothetical protein